MVARLLYQHFFFFNLRNDFVKCVREPLVITEVKLIPSLK